MTANTTPRWNVMSEIEAERAEQLALGWTEKHDASHNELEWGAILSMQCGKLAASALTIVASQATGAHNLAYLERKVWRKRLIQIAAVCMAAVEALDRSERREAGKKS